MEDTTYYVFTSRGDGGGGGHARRIIYTADNPRGELFAGRVTSEPRDAAVRRRADATCCFAVFKLGRARRGGPARTPRGLPRRIPPSWSLANPLLAWLDVPRALPKNRSRARVTRANARTTFVAH